MRNKVFICYRRVTADSARTIVTGLQQVFGEKVVFLDVDHLPVGPDFMEQLQSEIAKSAAMVVVIGKDWLTLAGDDGEPKIHDPTDPVHLEIAAALLSGIDVVPILVEGAQMPSESDLPPMLQPLARRHAGELPQGRFHKAAMQELVSAIRVSLKRFRPPLRQRLFATGGWAAAAAGCSVALFLLLEQGGSASVEPRIATRGTDASAAKAIALSTSTSEDATAPILESDGWKIESRIAETEPNDVRARANPLRPGEQLRGVVTTGEDNRDYFCMPSGFDIGNKKIELFVDSKRGSVRYCIFRPGDSDCLANEVTSGRFIADDSSGLVCASVSPFYDGANQYTISSKRIQ